MQAWVRNHKASRTATLPRIIATSLLLSAIGALEVGARPVEAAQAPSAAASASFGNPPSGEIPILYNDRTVYAAPDILKRNRVLAALEKDGHLYVPLRSMFEQMGATVSTSARGRTITATKSGTTVSVTVGRKEVILNGETRPLDVPPMLYKGVVLVPIRVISEALGAYVVWIPERRIVVVRYLSAVPPAAPVAEPTSPPSPAPTSAPAAPAARAVLATPQPTRAPGYGFAQAAYFAPKNYNEFSAGQGCPSYLLTVAYVFEGSKFAIKADYRHDDYLTSNNFGDSLGNRYTGFATIDRGTAFTPVFSANQSTLDARLEYQISQPNIYLGVGYLQTSNNFGYPQLHGVGVGIEKLPSLRPGVNVFGSGFYYPSAAGNYTVGDPASSNFGSLYSQKYDVVKYDVGLALVPAHLPVYLYGGYAGDRYAAKENAPVSQTHDGPYAGLGVKL